MILSRKHGLPLRAAQRQVNQVLKAVRDELDIKIIPRWNPEGTKATAKGTGFTAVLSNSPGLVQIKIELALLLLPFEGKIKDSVGRYMAQHLPLPSGQGRTDDGKRRTG